MRVHHKASALLLLAFTAFCMTLPHATRAQNGYTITWLGVLGNSPTHSYVSFATGINNRGDVVGYGNATDANGKDLGMAAFLSRRGTLIKLGNLGIDRQGYSFSLAFAISNAGQVVGRSTFSDAQHHSFGNRAFITVGSTLINLGTLGTDANGVNNSAALAVNEAGMVVGSSQAYDANHVLHGSVAFVAANGKMTELGSFGTDADGRAHSGARGISAWGQVVGYSTVYDSQHRSLGRAAFLYSRGAITNLGNLGTDTNGQGQSVANAINNVGEVVGSSTLYTPDHTERGLRAFLYSNGKMTDLGTLGNDSEGNGMSESLAVNDKGQIVGYSLIYTPTFLDKAAFLYQHGVMHNLNDFLPANSGWHLQTATGINLRGQICGVGLHNDRPEAFLMTPRLPHNPQ